MGGSGRSLASPDFDMMRSSHSCHSFPWSNDTWSTISQPPSEANRWPISYVRYVPSGLKPTPDIQDTFAEPAPAKHYPGTADRSNSTTPAFPAAFPPNTPILEKHTTVNDASSTVWHAMRMKPIWGESSHGSLSRPHLQPSRIFGGVPVRSYSSSHARIFAEPRA